jgi:hypothetical protein
VDWCLKLVKPREIRTNCMLSGRVMVSTSEEQRGRDLRA